MGATATDGKIFQFAASPPPSTGVFNLKGGSYTVAAIFSSLVTAIELQTLGPDGSTFISAPTPLKVSASPGSVAGQIPPGQYRFLLTGGGSTGTAFFSVAEIPT
jgi:hypothetical protein